MNLSETPLRSLVKSLTWRITATVATIILVWIFTGSPQIGLFVGAVEMVLKLVLYFLHERLWTQIGFGRRATKPMVLWFTGLSGAGKTTIAKALVTRLKESGRTCEWLDGDVTREVLPQTGFSREDRDAHVTKAGFIAHMLERNGVLVVASYISPYADARQKVRGMCHHFIEVHIATPLEECERRDVKGLYAKARRGEITQFTGIDDPYEPPANPEMRIDTTNLTPDQVVDQIMDYLRTA